MMETKMSEATGDMVSMKAVVDHLAEHGMLYMRGEPPRDQSEGHILVWWGGCNATIMYWADREEDWVIAETGCPLRYGPYYMQPSEGWVWMRLPHPSFWPEIDRPTNLVPTRDLFNMARDVFAWLASRLR